MIKRTLYFGNAAYLSRKDSQLVVSYPEDSGLEAKTVPIEDIGMIVIDHAKLHLVMRYFLHCSKTMRQ
jgi:CRISPR-associated protein Cas1